MTCPESALGLHDPDRRGLCCWCGQKVTGPVPRPRLRSWQDDVFGSAPEWYRKQLDQERTSIDVEDDAPE